MVKLKLFGVDVWVSYLFLAILSVLVLADKTGMLSNSLLSVVFHETGHFVALKLLCVGFTKIEFSLATVRITTREILGPCKSAIVAFCGPAINMILSFFVLCPQLNLKHFGAVNIVMFIFNMLPIKGLDGGDVLFGMLNAIGIKGATKVMGCISILVTVLIIVAGCALIYLTHQNVTLLLVGIYLFILSFNAILS